VTTTAPFVSVVVPCFNASAYISATLRSVVAQAGVALEIIVVDDGSSDDSAAVVSRDFPQVRLLTQTNAGVAKARNTGIRAARGDWIAFVDADDLWLPGKLAAQFAAMARHPGCLMSYTAWQVWPSMEAEPSPQWLNELQAQFDETSRWQGATGWLYPELLLDCVVWTSTVLMHRQVLDQTGLFDTDLRIGEDYDLWLRCSRVTRIERVAHPYALYRHHPASITKSAPTKNYRSLVIQRALDTWGFTGPDGREADHGAVQRGLAKSWSDHAAAQLNAGLADAARASARAALRCDQRHLPAWKIMVRAWLRSMRSNAAGRTT
jgi:glycosyltransferase involved in cell wall biosynthesis